MGSEDDDSEFGASSKIMLFAILSLFSAVLLIVFLYFYSRYLQRSEERRRRLNLNNLYRLNRQQIAPDQVGYQSSTETRLDPLIIASLPTFKYKPIDQVVDHGDTTECSICLGTIVEDVMIRLLPNCKHIFHVECIDMWLESHTTCPVCRTLVEPMVVQEEVKTEPSDQVQPSAPPLEESTSHGGSQLEKVNSSSSSRLGSFRRMFTRERSSRTRSCGDEISVNDIERQ